ncbi:MAG: class I tRNA ligase family protein [Acidimicrobiia bacterium]|nr:class I tRNA ligase family protein [Acidimicrobiia bacterium]
MTLKLNGTMLPIVGRARIYVCGITPYDTTHLGHAATFVWLDVAARVLEASGVNVDLCRNVTDVDDDILAQAQKRGVDYRVLGAEQTFRFEEDMRALHARRPTFEPRSRDFIEEVIALTRGLLEVGAAYERDGNVFFKGTAVEPYLGELSRDEAIALAAERGGKPDDPLKDDPLDVPLWQKSSAGEPAWASPWGDGRPGWHAECSAMAMSLLGTAVDIHGGGKDLEFPHHAYESAQSELLTGVSPFVRAWMHVGTVSYEGEKMSKSLGNLVYVSDLVEHWDPAAVRLLLIDRPWHEDWSFEDGMLAAASARLERLWSSAGRASVDDKAYDAALATLEDDLDVRGALAIAEEAGGAALRRLGGLLGLL